MVMPITNSTKTLAEMRNTIYFLISESPNSRIFTTANVDTALNMGLTKVAKLINRTPIEIQTSTEANVSEYELPDPLLQNGRAQVDEVRINGEVIDPIEREVSGEVGEPNGWFIVGKTLTLVPTPDAVYTVDLLYRQEHRPLTDEAETTNISDSAVHAGILYACYLLKLKDEEFKSADRFREEYEDALKDATQLQTGVYKADVQVTFSGAV